jgi:ElaB/YqjD/DUF883 family membrane-anchored ribosome-binding protein
MMGRTEANGRATGETLASQLDELIQSASNLLDTLDEQRGEATDAIRSRMRRNIEGARRRLEGLAPQVAEGATQVTEGATRAARAAAGFARRNPWSTVAVGTVLVASIATILYASLSRD